jgi:serine/threonine-protein kinase RsbW
LTNPDLKLVLPAEAKNVGVVRHALAGLAEALGMDAGRIGDLKTVVTEACMNAVVHAYEESPGAIEVDAHREDDELVIVVRDQGAGIRPRANIERESLRMGLPLIAALSSSFELSGAPGRGTVVTMRVSLSSNGSDPDLPAPAQEVDPGAAMLMPAGNLVGPVLSRVISIFAVRADFSVDRLSDAVLLGDAVSSQAADFFPDGNAKVVVDEVAGTVSVRVGPLVDGAGERLLERMRIPELDASLERLADSVRVERDEDDEHLLIEITGRAA